MPHHLVHGPEAYPQGANHSSRTIAISGPTCSGKTQLLYLLIASFILPPAFSTTREQEQDIEQGSLHGEVIVLDADGRFDVARLTTALSQHLPADSGEQRTALERVHVFRPTSTPSLLATIESIPTYLDSLPQSSQKNRLAAVVLDSASAFLYQDLAAVHTVDHSHGQTEAPTALSALRRLQEAYSCLLVTTTRQPARSHGRGVHRALNLRTRRLVPPPFGPGLSAEEALRDRERRQEVVDRGMFVCEALEEREQDGIGMDRGAYDSSGRGFRFWIRAEGVGISEAEPGLNV